jgi:hypothetical protein
MLNATDLALHAEGSSVGPTALPMGIDMGESALYLLVGKENTLRDEKLNDYLDDATQGLGSAIIIYQQKATVAPHKLVDVFLEADVVPQMGTGVHRITKVVL